MTDFEARVQATAEAHLAACFEAMESEREDTPAYGPFDGCHTCVVREVLAVTWEQMLSEATNRAADRWRCGCDGLNHADESSCYRCGASRPDTPTEETAVGFVTDALAHNTDAQAWTRAWIETMTRMSSDERSAFVCDEGTMLGWFANAIGAGHDAGLREATPELQAPASRRYGPLGAPEAAHRQAVSRGADEANA